MEGSATKTEPASPVKRPKSTRLEGALRAITVATMATKIGVTAFNIPVNAEETCCSANGNMLSGRANQRMPSNTIPGQAERSMVLRAAGNSASVRKPTEILVKVTPFGATDLSPSAMNRNDAPQMIPGIATSSQSVEVILCASI